MAPCTASRAARRSPFNHCAQLMPAGIIESLELKRPVYRETASYGHFGRPQFAWEKTDKAEQLRGLLR